MTDVLLHPDDSGEIPALPGETSRLITAAERERLLGEQTENLGRYLADSPSFEAIPRKVFDIDDTVRFGLPKSLRMDLKALHATIDGELRPAAPGPLPTPLPPDPQPAPAPEVKPGYEGRHRLTLGRRVRRLIAGMGVVGLAVVAIWAGLILAGAAVFL